MEQRLAALKAEIESNPEASSLVGQRYGNGCFLWTPGLANAEYLDGTLAITGTLSTGGSPALKSTGSSTLVRGRGEHRLTVSHSGTTLLLEETRDELGLTARERQVLAWVARGKRNSEVAEILWLTPSTVRKHLENAYAKLGVHTRTAAVTRFLGVLDRE